MDSNFNYEKDPCTQLRKDIKEGCKDLHASDWDDFKSTWVSNPTQKHFDAFGRLMLYLKILD